MRPKSITLVGASERPDSWPARIFRNLRNYAYPGEIHLVNPRHRELYGAPCYPSLQEIPGLVDQIVVVVPAPHIPAVLEQAGQRACRSAVIFSGGFSETGAATGAALEREMLLAAERHGILIGGPNCLGNVSTRERVMTMAEHSLQPFPPGGLALISQSSGLMGGLARYAMTRGLGLSYGVASGSEANVDAADYLHFLVEDPSTQVIVLVLEAIRRPVEFAAACQRARALRKPILALKIGKSKKGQAAALSHTGALAGSYEAFVAFCRRYGILEMRGFDECIETAELFLRCPLPPASGIAALALSGGARGYLDDLGEELGIDFPPPTPEIARELDQLIGVGAGAGNPLDVGAAGASDPQFYLRCLQLFLSDPRIGLVALQGDLPQGPEFAARAAVFKTMIEHAKTAGKPIVFYSRTSQPVSDFAARFREECGAPFMQELRQTFQAIGHFMRFRNMLAEGEPQSPVATRDARTVDESGSLAGLKEEKRSKAVTFPSDAEAFAMLQRAGIAVVPFEVCLTVEHAQRAAEAIGFPVALKLSAPGLTHKTEIAGVWLSLSNPQEIARAFLAVQEKMPASGERAAVLIQKMFRGVLELYVGGRSDPEFGPLVVFGLGGLFVEALGRTSSRLAPVELREAGEMLIESGVDRALRRLPLDSDVCRRNITQAIIQMSQLIAAERTADTIEVNPLILTKNGNCVAVDVVAMIRA